MAWGWPWQKTEVRESGYTDALVRLIEAQAAGEVADVASTAAVEAASGALSRAMASARVEGPDYVTNAVTPVVLGQIGRDLIRHGCSLHRIDVGMMGMVKLLPAEDFYFMGGPDPSTWMVEVTAYGPTRSSTHTVPYTGVVYVRWGSRAGQPHLGTGPLSWAHTTARLQSETERALADEAAGPMAHLLPVPGDGGDGTDNDPYKELKADIRAGRGRAHLVETTRGGHGEGMPASPQRDWVSNRLGASPPQSMAKIRSDTFEAVLAATGTPPSLFTDSDGTSQREAVRRWHMNTVLPLARLLETELSEKLEASVSLAFDNYPLDLAGRAQAFQKLVAGGVPVNEALVTAGLLTPDAA